MSKGVNKAILVGHLGKDPDVRYFQNGDAVANVSLATSETWKDKQTGEIQERTEWHNLVFHKRLAEIAGEYLRKGSQIYAEGKLKTRKWQDKQGNDRYTTEVIVNDMQMLGGRGDSEPQRSAGDEKAASFDAQKPAQPAVDDDIDETIPF